jgi:hypothetical protein
MPNQAKFAAAAARVADYLKRHADCFVEDGPTRMVGEQRSNHVHKIESCAERMIFTRTYQEFETVLAEVHRLGAYPRNEDVSAVAFASLAVEVGD